MNAFSADLFVYLQPLMEVHLQILGLWGASFACLPLRRGSDITQSMSTAKSSLSVELVVIAILWKMTVQVHTLALCEDK